MSKKKKRKAGRARAAEVTTRLTVRLFLLMAVCAVLCCSCFRILMLNQTNFYQWMVKKGICGLDTKTIVEEVSERAKNIPFKGATHKELSRALELEKYNDGYTSVYIYRDAGDSNEFEFGITPEVWDSPFIKPFWYSDLGYYKGLDVVKNFKFQDMEASIAIYSYHQAQIAFPYMVVSFIISLLFFLPVIMYMRNRMRYVGKLKNEILIIADGDLEHPVTVKGRDEIGILARELDKMRRTLNENIKKEEESRKSNHELIRSVSHDLRTPMTTMYGYLEILEHKQCTPQQQKEYISRCIQKMEEIRCLSDKMFEYAFVYGTQEQEEQTPLYVEELLEELEKSGQFLELKGYKVAYEMEGQGKILGSRIYFQRIWNNLFSNILKYGEGDVRLKSCVEKGAIQIELINQVNRELTQVESNRIGLKSVEKMVERQNGSFFVTEEESTFAVTLKFPLI